MFRNLSAVLFATLAWATALSAGDRVVVVELYTSQGCSSCPPADVLLGELAQRDDVIPLAFHVDYWDYIGWKDEFAHSSHTKRQKGYAYAAGQRTIYTPQMIVGGLDHVVGYKPMQLGKFIQSHSDTMDAVDISLTRQGDAVNVNVPSVAGMGPLELHFIRYMPKSTVAIRRGENRGRTLDYHNIVTQWQPLGEWDGQSDFNTSVEAAGDNPVVIIVQKAMHGQIVAAARLR